MEQQEALAKSLMPHDTSERPALMLAPRRYPLFVSVKGGAYRVPVLPGHTGLARLFPLAYDIGDDLTKGPTVKLLASLYDQHPSFKGCFSFELFIQSAEPESTVCEGGNVIDLYRLPEHCSFDGPEYIEYAEFTVELSSVAPHLRTPVRLALFNTKEEPVWDESGVVESQRRLAESNEVSDFLRAETHRSIQEMMEIASKLCVLYDTTTSPSAPAAYALRSKAVAALTKLIGEKLQARSLDAPSAALYKSVVMRHDRFIQMFGTRSDVDDYELGYGPSQTHPQSCCVYIYDRDRPDHRVDVGLDSTLAKSLQAVPNEPPEANLKRRCQQAIRTETIPVRKATSTTASTTCGHPGCAAPAQLSTPVDGARLAGPRGRGCGGTAPRGHGATAVQQALQARPLTRNAAGSSASPPLPPDGPLRDASHAAAIDDAVGGCGRV